MKKMFFMLAILISASTIAKTVVVTDIDDTIKISQIRSFAGKIATAALTDIFFKGMPGLLTELQKDGATIFYLSNAPKIIMENKHRELLENGNFPNGTMLLKENIFDSNHKLKKIINIIKTEKPTKLILIGDNGEKDPSFYNEIYRRYKNVEILSYIRAMYPLSGKGQIFNEQESFVTAVDIAISLKRNGTFSYQQFALFTGYHIPRILVERSTERYTAWYIPSWADCSGHVIDTSQEREFIKIYARHINKRCTSKLYEFLY